MLTDQDLDLGSAWTTAIMTIGAMSSGLKKVLGIKQSLVKSVSTEDKNTVDENPQITFRLVQILNVWVHAQWKLDH